MKVLKSVMPARAQMITVKVSADELKKMKAKAKLWADGSLSHWIRYACQELEPRKEDLVELTPKGR